MGQNLQSAAGTGSVKIHSPSVRQCSASLWAESPILRNLAPSAIPEINCDEETWKQLENVHQGGPFPTDLEQLYKLLAVTVQLQLKDLTRLSLKKLFNTPDYWEIHYPNDIPDEIVLLCFRESSSRLFRTEAVYRHELGEILCLPRGPRLKASLTDELNSKIGKFVELELDRVPLEYRMPCVPMMIMRRKGELKTALYIGKSCKTFELFGKYFDLSRVDIDAFHLKYASYVLYKSGERVYFKDIQCEAEAVPCLDNCKIFISKKDNILVVTKEKNEYHIRMWIDHDDFGSSFADIYSTTDEIKSIDIGSSEVFLILKEDGSLSAAERGTTGIVITDLGKGYRSAWFHNCAIYALRLKEGHSEKFEMHRFKQVSATSWEVLTDFSERRSLRRFAKRGCITSIGGELFRISENGLEVYSESGSHTLVLRSGEYVASSELHLHP